MTKFEKFQVGGIVRDTIMGRASKDVDYVVVGGESFEEMVAWVAETHEIFVTTPATFTARGRRKDSRQTFDFVWARKEGPYSDGRHPDFVEPGDLNDDLARRDFTINAIAMSDDGEIFDPFDGQFDIGRKMIRAVGDPRQRFIEDQLRIIRAIRFAVVFGFDIESDTAAAMRAMAHRIPFTVSQERVREEMTKAFQHNTIATFRMLERFGMADVVFRDGMWAMPTTKGA